jgi:hypothetical protein
MTSSPITVLRTASPLGLWPAFQYPIGQGFFPHIKVSGQCGDRDFLPLEYDNSVGPKVGGLLGRGCPPAIFWRITFAAINAVKRHACWALAHILKECRKFLPSIANRNSHGAVSRELGSIGVPASLGHALPRVVRGAGRVMARMSMLRHLRTHGAASGAEASTASADPVLLGCEVRSALAANAVNVWGFAHMGLQFSQVYMAGGRVMAGLTKRRASERAVFEGQP